MQPLGGVLGQDLRLGGEHIRGYLRDGQAEHLGAVVLPGGDHGTQGAGLAGTGRANQQPDAPLRAEQLADRVCLIAAEVMLDDGRLDEVALERYSLPQVCYAS